MIGVGITAPGADKVQATVDTDLVHGFTAVTNIVFAFCKCIFTLNRLESETNYTSRTRRLLRSRR
jgi:hypothetical protein